MISRGTAKPYINFIGNSSTNVTGSMHHLRFKKYSLLLDCGMIQDGDLVANYKANLEQLKKIKPTETDYIILSHCHVDHSGLIPALFARGCQAHVYVPKGSLPILKLLWEDSMKIIQSDCAKMVRKHNIKASPFYDESHIQKALRRCIEVEYAEPYKINESITFTYYPAGHIVHSAQVYIELKEGYMLKRIGYTGDIGGSNIRNYTEPKWHLPFCDLIIGENTYNPPSRPNKPKDRYNDLKKIESVVNESNKILIPTFSFGRTQELLSVLYQMNQEKLIDDIPIYLDSPLSQKLCSIWDSTVDIDIELWKKVWAWKNLHVLSTWAESESLQHRNEHCIILSASGFLTGGRVLGHLKTVLKDPRNHILFVGYAGENNLASQIKENIKEVMVDGELIQNNANITELRSFSSHASYEELIDYYAQLKYNKLALVHGDEKNKPEFANVLQNKLIENGNSARVICTNKNQKIYI